MLLFDFLPHKVFLYALSVAIIAAHPLFFSVPALEIPDLVDVDLVNEGFGNAGQGAVKIVLYQNFVVKPLRQVGYDPR